MTSHLARESGKYDGEFSSDVHTWSDVFFYLYFCSNLNIWIREVFKKLMGGGGGGFNLLLYF